MGNGSVGFWKFWKVVFRRFPDAFPQDTFYTLLYFYISENYNRGYMECFVKCL